MDTQSFNNIPTIPGAYEDRTGLPRSKRKKRDTIDLLQEEKELQTLVFGEGKLNTGNDYLDNDSSDTSDNEMNEDINGCQQTVLETKPAWQDDDDEILRVDIAAHKGLRKLRRTEEETEISGREYTNRLRAQFQKLSQQPLWSLPDINKPHSDHSSTDDDSDDDDDILRHTSNLLATSVTKLPGGILNIKKMSDANISRRAQAVIRSVEFHPSTNIVLTAGMHKTLSLFQIDGVKNPHLQSVFVKRFPIQTAHFTRSGEEIVMAGGKHWYYVYDIPSGKVMMINDIKGHSRERFANFKVSPDDKIMAFLGKDGYIVLVSNKTKQWIGDLKMNGTVSDIAFTPDSQYLLSTGSDGHVYTWDIRSSNCIHRFVDDGCVKGTTIGISPNGQFIATGSDSGVVNVYDQSCLTQAKPRPLKAVMNLTTSISNINFNPSSEVLSIISKEKKSAIKLVHLSSMSVFSNWPSSRVSLDYISSVNFSSDSHYMVIGNDKGKAPLYRLSHFYKSKSTQ